MIFDFHAKRVSSLSFLNGLRHAGNRDGKVHGSDVLAGLQLVGEDFAGIVGPTRQSIGDNIADARNVLDLLEVIALQILKPAKQTSFQVLLGVDVLQTLVIGMNVNRNT